MKWITRLVSLGCMLSLGSIAPAFADRLPQQVSEATAGWPVGNFVLTDHRGAPFTQENLLGRWTLLLLEDACGAPCEAALSALAGVYRRINQTEAIRHMQVVLVSPNSTPPEWKTLARFDPRFIGAVGSRPALQGLADDLGVGVPTHANAASARSAAGSIWVIGPDGILRAELLPPFDVLLLTAEFMKIRSRR
jgi:protein SCO1/2